MKAELPKVGELVVMPSAGWGWLLPDHDKPVPTASAVHFWLSSVTAGLHTSGAKLRAGRSTLGFIDNAWRNICHMAFNSSEVIYVCVYWLWSRPKWAWSWTRDVVVQGLLWAWTWKNQQQTQGLAASEMQSRTLGCFRKPCRLRYLEDDHLSRAHKSSSLMKCD